MHRVRVTRLFIMLLAVCLPLGAQAQRIGGPQCADPSQSLAWEVSGRGMEARGVRIHLFGSIHVGKADFYPLHPTLQELFRSSDKLVFEIDPSAATTDLQAAMQLQLRGMLPAGQTLDQVVSAQTMADLEAVMGEMGIPLQAVMNFKPWMVALTLSNLQVMALGYNPLYGLEMYLLGQKPASMQVLELESLEQQLGMLEALPPETFLSYTLEEFERGPAMINAMIEAWLCGDKQGLADIVALTDEMAAEAAPAERGRLEELYERLYTVRNQVMAEGVEEFALGGEGAYFVVVGAAHLLGQDSVVDLLRRRGFTVSPVRLTP